MKDAKKGHMKEPCHTLVVTGRNTSMITILNKNKFKWI